MGTAWRFFQSYPFPPERMTDLRQEIAVRDTTIKEEECSVKKLFRSDKFFKLPVFFSAFCAIYYLFYFIIPFEKLDGIDLSWILTDIILGICPVVLYISYDEHNKNFMKGMIGLLLGIVLMDDVQSLAYFISEEDPYYIVSICFLALDLVLIVNHFILNSDRRSKPLHVTIGQVNLCLQAIAITVGYLIYLVVPSPDMIGAAPEEYVLTIVEGLNYISIYTVIVCIESRLDAFRIDRENAGWTPEGGYPEGYVHEYQKK